MSTIAPFAALTAPEVAALVTAKSARRSSGIAHTTAKKLPFEPA
jgi:hypothetical protein